MKTRQEILAEIRRHFPGDVGLELNETVDLAELGITSLHLITLVLTLQKQYGIAVDHLVESGMPTTVGEVVNLVERASIAASTLDGGA
jgi:acyl carrier protein